MPRLNDEARAKILELYASGLSGSKVGKEVGYSLATVMKVVREAGIERLYGPASARRPGRAVHWTRVQNSPGRGGWVWKGRYKGKSLVLSEARVMASKKLGRALGDDEYVHFHDGNPLNTDEENLFVDKNSKFVQPTGLRFCIDCEENRRWPTDFPDGGGHVCSLCSNERRRRAKLKRKYGLTDDEINAQPDGCVLCGAPCSTGRRTSADHDHETGEFRGWLCVRHNMGIGYFQDDPKQLVDAIRYLVGDDTEALAVLVAYLVRARSDT